MGRGEEGPHEGPESATGKEAARTRLFLLGLLRAPGGFLHLSQFACLCVVAADLA